MSPVSADRSNLFTARGVAMSAAAATLLVLLAGCAGAPPASAPDWRAKLASSGWKLGPEVPSVTRFSVSSFEALDDRHVVLDLIGASRRVLVTAGPGCFGLEDARRIGWRSFGSTLNRFDELRVRPHGQPAAASCRVESIHQLTPVSG